VLIWSAIPLRYAFLKRWSGCSSTPPGAFCWRGGRVKSNGWKVGEYAKGTIIGIDLAKNVFQMHGASNSAKLKFRPNYRCSIFVDLWLNNLALLVGQVAEFGRRLQTSQKFFATLNSLTILYDKTSPSEGR